VKNTNKKKK